MSAGRSLVTGGGGFIGRHLVRLLLERGEHVRVLELEGVALDGLDVEAARGSICDPGVVRRALTGVHRLYHLAGNPNLWARDKGVFARVNHGGTRTVLAEAARFDLERIVFTSTESILKGRHAIGAPIDECAAARLEDMSGPYCRSKLLAEQTAFDAARRGQPVVIVSPTMPVGPGDRNLTPPTRMVLQFLNRQLPAYFDCGLNLVDVRDVAAGHLLAAERGRIGERYILGNANLMMRDILAILEELTGVPKPRFAVPYWLALASGVASEFLADFVTHRPPAAPLTGVRLTATPMFFDSSKAVRELRLPQTPVRVTLADAVAWLVDAGLVMKAFSRPPPSSKLRLREGAGLAAQEVQLASRNRR